MSRKTLARDDIEQGGLSGTGTVATDAAAPPGDSTTTALEACEKAAMGWLSSLGHPCWMSDSPPGNGCRYGLVMHDGRRIAVGPGSKTGWTFEGMARAKCDFLLCMAPDEEGVPKPAGFLTWCDARALAAPDQEIDFEKTGARRPGALPALLEKPRSRRLAWLRGTLRLLIRGEIPAPPPGDWSGLELPAKE